MGLTTNKHIAQYKKSDPKRAGSILGFANFVAWCSSGMMAVALFLAAPWLASRALGAHEIVGPIQIGAGLLFLSGINGAQLGALSGFEAFREIAKISFITGVLNFPLMLVGSYLFEVNGAIGSLVLTQLANCFLCSLTLRRKLILYGIKQRLEYWRDELPLFWNFSLPALLTGLLNSVAAWAAGAYLVNQVNGYGEMGVYNAVLRVKLLPETLVTILVAPMLPILSQSYAARDDRTFKKTLLFNFFLATVIVTPVSILQATAPHLTLAPFGAEFNGHPAIVQWLMLHSVAYSLLYPMGTVLISMGRMWFSWGVNMLFATLSFGLSWVLISWFGASGFAAAQAIAFALANIPCVYFLFREQGDVMRILRWNIVATTGFVLFLVGASFRFYMPISWTIPLGLSLGVGFLVIKYRLHSKTLARELT